MMIDYLYSVETILGINSRFLKKSLYLYILKFFVEFTLTNSVLGDRQGYVMTCARDYYKTQHIGM